MDVVSESFQVILHCYLVHRNCVA
jgi:hypothetical protein